MTQYEMLSFVVSIVAAAISIVSLLVAIRSNVLNKKMFRRDKVIDLHTAWDGVNGIDRDNLVGPDVIKGANALALTASIWLHDIMEKAILHQTYWEPYKNLFDEMDALTALIPGTRRTGKSMLTSEIRRTYKEMEAFDLNKVSRTRL
jgi:hypothetical protein